MLFIWDSNLTVWHILSGNSNWGLFQTLCNRSPQRFWKILSEEPYCILPLLLMGFFISFKCVSMETWLITLILSNVFIFKIKKTKKMLLEMTWYGVVVFLMYPLYFMCLSLWVVKLQSKRVPWLNWTKINTWNSYRAEEMLNGFMLILNMKKSRRGEGADEFRCGGRLWALNWDEPMVGWPSPPAWNTNMVRRGGPGIWGWAEEIALSG